MYITYGDFTQIAGIVNKYENEEVTIYCLKYRDGQTQRWWVTKQQFPLSTIETRKEWFNKTWTIIATAFVVPHWEKMP